MKRTLRMLRVLALVALLALGGFFLLSRLPLAPATMGGGSP